MRTIHLLVLGSVIAIGYSARPLLQSEESGGQCCATGQDCLSGVCRLPNPGQDSCSNDLPGFCVPIPDP